VLLDLNRVQRLSDLQKKPVLTPRREAGFNYLLLRWLIRTTPEMEVHSGSVHFK
jgi:hypothetical protein